LVDNQPTNDCAAYRIKATVTVNCQVDYPISVLPLRLNSATLGSRRERPSGLRSWYVRVVVRWVGCLATNGTAYPT